MYVILFGLEWHKVKVCVFVSYCPVHVLVVMVAQWLVLQTGNPTEFRLDRVPNGQIPIDVS